MTTQLSAAVISRQKTVTELARVRDRIVEIPSYNITVAPPSGRIISDFTHLFRAAVCSSFPNLVAIELWPAFKGLVTNYTQTLRDTKKRTDKLYGVI